MEPVRGRPALAAAVLLCASLVACDAPGPEPGSPEYAEAVAAFHTGVAAIQVGEDVRAESALSRVLELAPREPAAAANLAIVAYQQRRLDEAITLIERARAGAPDEARLRMLAALVERARGRLDPAIDHLREAAESRPGDARVRHLLARMLEERAAPDDIAASRHALDEVLAADSVATWSMLESARHAARHDDAAALGRALDLLTARAAAWPEPDRALLDRARALAARTRAAGTELTLLAASLDASPAYARERDSLVVSEQQPDLVFTEFLRLPAPSPLPPPPDVGLRFAVRPLSAPSAAWLDVRPIWLAGEAPARIALLEAGGVWLAGDAEESGVIGGGVSAAANTATLLARPESGSATAAFAALDLDHDFRMDLALAGDAGLAVVRQDSVRGFVALAGAALPPGTLARALVGAWAADTDLDGDVDLVLAPREGPPFVLRNQGDGTFSDHAPFDSGVGGARDFVWGDLDADGDADAAFLDASGALHVLGNPRQDRPRFDRIAVPSALGPAAALALGDVDADGRFDLLVLRDDGALVRASRTGDTWQTVELARWRGFAGGDAARLFVADLDNNGALDVAASAAGRTQLWLADSAYALRPHQELAVKVTAVADLSGRGRIELLGLDAEGRPVRLAARPTRDYFALTIGPRATQQPGDRRINTFGIGGEAEVRAGMLYQKQPIAAPFVHFGIGENTGVTVARIVWPNGTAQAEFDLLASQSGPIVAEQRLKGSCPWLFAFDGTAMRFVTDVAWRTALGLRISAYGASSIIHSEDWVKVPGDRLAARDGAYALSITGELWESHFFDHVALLAVDHPAGTEVFVDERFSLPPPELKLHATDGLSPIARATDGAGRDVMPLVTARDERYVDTFELGAYQGVAAREHLLEVDLGADAPAAGPLLLVAHGWVYPTDGSINLALGQGSRPAPRGLRAEVPDGRGGWRVLHADLGMPAGKTKTVLIDLAGAFGAGAPARVRLYTNLEIYWDHIAWTVARPETELRVARMTPARADLRYRGFSHTRQAGRRAPELPEYALAGTAPAWPDLEGHHTRFGDVRPLLEHVDDRYVIMNAGDELALEFAAPPAPPEGWTRDFVLVSDAWVKDGDYNNGFSGTLLPLPFHGMTDYSVAPGRLQDDPAFRRHPADWLEYHTRWVAATPFRRALARD